MPDRLRKIHKFLKYLDDYIINIKTKKVKNIILSKC